MSERAVVPRRHSSPNNPIPESNAPAPGGNITQTEDDVRARVAALEREAKAMGNEPGAALLFHEIGLLWEEVLKNPRNAAVAYQAAYRISPAFAANIRAARRLF